MEKQKDIVREANIHFFAKMAVNALLIVLGALFITFFLRHMQQQASLSKQRQTSMVALEEVVSVLEENAEDAADIVRIFHKGNQDMVDDLKELIDGGVFTSAVFSERETSSDILKDMMERNIAFRQVGQEELRRAEAELMAPLRQRLSTVLAELARQRGLAFILNTDSNAAPYINPEQGDDLNQPVLDALSK